MLYVGTVVSIKEQKTRGGGGVQQLLHRGPQEYQQEAKTDTGVKSPEPNSLERT